MLTKLLVLSLSLPSVCYSGLLHITVITITMITVTRAQEVLSPSQPYSFNPSHVSCLLFVFIITKLSWFSADVPLARSSKASGTWLETTGRKGRWRQQTAPARRQYFWMWKRWEAQRCSCLLLMSASELEIRFFFLILVIIIVMYVELRMYGTMTFLIFWL